jgi:hypothetical protein
MTSREDIDFGVTILSENDPMPPVARDIPLRSTPLDDNGRVLVEDDVYMGSALCVTDCMEMWFIPDGGSKAIH